MGLLGRVIAGGVSGGAGQHIKNVEKREADAAAAIKDLREQNLVRLRTQGQKEVMGLSNEGAMARTEYTQEAMNQRTADTIAGQKDVAQIKANQAAEEEENKPVTTSELNRVDNQAQAVLGREDFVEGEWISKGKPPTAAQIKKINDFRAAAKLPPLKLENMSEKKSLFGADVLWKDKNMWRLTADGADTAAMTEGNAKVMEEAAALVQAKKDGTLDQKLEELKTNSPKIYKELMATEEGKAFVGKSKPFVPEKTTSSPDVNTMTGKPNYVLKPGEQLVRNKKTGAWAVQDSSGNRTPLTANNAPKAGIMRLQSNH